MAKPSPAFIAAFLEALANEPVANKAELHLLKHRVARATASPMPRDGEILEALDEGDRTKWRSLLQQKPMRTQSGVAIVAVMSSPEGCPHGKCVFCPGGPEVDAPQSYTGFEPSTMRAKVHGYDPYRITRSRISQLERNGHPIDKVDVIVQGGTFPARDVPYQDWFIASIYAGLNDGPDPTPGPWESLDSWRAMSEEDRCARLIEVQQANESADHRAIGLTVETKPDWCLESHVDIMLRQGVTRVELGLQTFDEQTLRFTHRGHTLQDSADAMRILRDAGLKVCVHMMPGLPRPRGTLIAEGETLAPVGIHGGDLDPEPRLDLEDAKELWADSRWRPDMLKVYPTLVVHEGETPLKKWWKEGRYHPYDTAEARPIVAEMLTDVPTYCRVQRVDRDIPTTHVDAGVQNSNLRQMAEADAAADGRVLHELRAREVGARNRQGIDVDSNRAELVRLEYEASGGTEVFLSLEDPVADAVLGFVRLRRVGLGHRPEMKNAAVVRELKVFGAQVPVGAAPGEATQHRGHGSRLMQEAEAIAQEWGCARLLVTAGVGVKAYYRARNYHDVGPYVAREIPCPHPSITSNASNTS